MSPSSAYLKDLVQFIKKFQSADEAIILMGDFKCSLTDPLMKKIMTRFCLKDVISGIIGDTPPTRDPGSNTIDHVLCTPELFESISRAEYLPFRYGIDSDHRAIIMDMDLKRTGGEGVGQGDKKQRKIESRNCRAAKQ